MSYRQEIVEDYFSGTPCTYLYRTGVCKNPELAEHQLIQ